MKNGILFICKKNQSYNGSDYSMKQSGLYNSTSFIVDSLRANNIKADIVDVVDNNDIDREVTKHRPKIVIIEALWVVPEKFSVLQRLHPDVRWYVHLHSNIPFLSLEGMAIEWIWDYGCNDVGLIVNSREAQAALERLYPDVLLLENIYPAGFKKPLKHKRGELHIGCFGAIRPFKNTLIQAMAAVKVAEKLKKKLHFYVNSTRIEGRGDSVLKNLREYFGEIWRGDAELRELGWLSHEDLLRKMRDMDVSLQVSLSETFNVVTADAVSSGVPIVVSDEIKWASELSKAKCNDVESIAAAIHLALRLPIIVRLNQLFLAFHSWRAKRAWLRFARRALSRRFDANL